ncbi:hypothetical protein LTR95_015614 [Oleoguttula sp. CCFEE 5521]
MYVPWIASQLLLASKTNAFPSPVADTLSSTAGTARLTPAFHLMIPFTPFGENYRLGPNNEGHYFEYSPSFSEGSYLLSEPGYGENKVNATIAFGAANVHLQPSFATAKLQYNGIAVTDDNANIYFEYTGTVDGTGPDTKKLFTGDPSFNGSDWGYGSINLSFQTSPGKYKFLEDVNYVGSQRYIVYGDKILGLEFKISEVQ